jgi:signal transduction histidine kinase/ligand-binding sensor domain-containing protein
MFRERILNLFFLLFAVNIVLAANRNIEFDHYTPDDGLPNGYIQTFLHDSRGFMWIGTINGLSRFDGISFRNYYHNPNDSLSLTSSTINQLIEDKDGNIWILNNRGLCRYNRDHDNFIRIKIKFDSIQYDELYLTSGHIDSKHQLWMAVANLGIMQLNLNDFDLTARQGNVRLYQLSEPDVEPIYKNNIYAIAEDQNKQIWLASFSKYMFYYDPKSGSFKAQSTEHPDEALFSNNRKNLLIDRDGDFHIAIEQVGLLKWNPSVNQAQLYKDTNDGRGIAGEVPFALCEDHEGKIWIGDRNAMGISILDKTSESFQYVRYGKYNPYSLNTNKINTVYEDRDKNIWVGTITGLDKFSPGKSKFQRYYNDPESSVSLSHNNTLCFEESSDGNIWIGTDGGGLNYFDRNKNTFTVFEHDKNDASSISSNSIISLCEDHEGTLWIATFNGGLSRLKNGKFTAFLPDNHDPYSISNRNIWYVFEDSKRNLWVGTLNSGLHLYDRQTGRFHHYTHSEDDPASLCNNAIIQIYESSQQKLYITTYGGVSILDLNASDFSSPPARLEFENLYHNNSNNSLSNNEIYCAYEDSNGIIWFGTIYTGLDRYDPKTKQFTNYNTSHGLPGNSISAILGDHQNNLWLASDNGLCRFDPETGETVNFDLKDGLQNKSLKSWAIKTRDGAMFFGGPNGFNSFYPKDFDENKHEQLPPVYITGFRIFNQTVNIGQKINNRIILEKAINESNSLTLSHKENYFTFEFRSLDFVSPEKTAYAYKMEGFDKDWVYIGNRHEASYTNLDPGSYTFTVLASKDGVQWKEEGHSLHINILPPWWDTLWFKLLLAFLLTSLVGSIIWYRIHRFRQRQKKLETMIAEKTSELQMKNQELQQLNATKDKFFSIIAHDIRSPFHAILGLSDIVIQNFKEWSDEQLLKHIEHIHQSANKLNQLLENLLQWSRSQQGRISFNPERIVLAEVLDETIKLLSENAKAKQIELNYHIDNERLVVDADRHMLNTILRNLVSNAIKFTHKDGHVSISAKLNSHELVNIEVNDDGIGISENVRQKLLNIETSRSTPGTNNETGSGLGLILAKEFVSKHGGTMGIISNLGNGSTFYFTLPVKQH